ncbi:ribonuclease Z [Candidatus Woesearchaeota archaeon CG07_land_8_20_14_0_80_44_23]|nr:MAG: ribonuclease Z [Candidatus Woesearchaeota archaeon CG07_land_8_20_14_0_80_44_23]
MAEMVFLGTSSMVPTKERNHSSFFLGFRAEGILFDCGEGTQRQLKIAGINPNRITKILISHWHGDHTLGIPGLLQTLAANKYDKTLKIYGPKGTKKSINYILKTFAFLNSISMEIFEIKKTMFYENDEYALEAYPLEHKIPCLGFRFVEKDITKVDMAKAKKLGLSEGPIIGKLQSGKSVIIKGRKIKPSDVTYIQKGRTLGYIADTNRCENCSKIAKDADILISESTFESKLDEKAEDYTHMTARDAAMVAAGAGAKKLILTHFSQRYASVEDLQEEAKTYFPNSVCAYDFMKVQF